MARGDYGPEIKDAIGSAPKGKPRVGPTDTAKPPTAAPRVHALVHQIQCRVLVVLDQVELQ